MLKKPFLCLLFSAGTTFAFSIGYTDMKPHPENKVTVLPQMASEPQVVDKLELQQQSNELQQQVTNESQVASEPINSSMWRTGERQRLGSTPVPVREIKTRSVISQNTGIQQEVKLSEQKEKFVPKKLIIMPIPENPTWMKPNNQDENYILLDKQGTRYYPVKNLKRK